MAITTASQSQVGQDTAKNSQVVTTVTKNFNSGSYTGPVITSIIITDSSYNTLDDTAVAASNAYIKIIGTGFLSTANVYIGGTQVPTANVTYTSSTELRVAIPPLTVGSNNSISLFNSTGTGTIYASTLLASGFPTVTTSSYTADSLTVSTQLLATGDGTLSYSLKPGSSLPDGLSLSSTGLISGTTIRNIVKSFTVLVDDSQGQTTQQDITLTVASGDPYYKYTTLLLQADKTGNNSTNGTFVDSSSNGLTLTANGAPYQGTVNPFGTGTWSNYFAGNSLTVGESSNVAVGTSDFTFEAWIYPVSTVTWNSIISTRPTAATSGFSNVWVLGFHSTGYPYVYSGDMQAVGSANAIVTNTWTHVAVSRSNSSMKLFVNGTVANTAVSSQNYTDTTATIGSNNDGSEYFTGYISNARLVKGTALYTSAFTPADTPLTAVANTVLLTCQSNQFKDNSTNNLSITPTANVSINKFNPFALDETSYEVSANTFAGSTYFNGSTDYLSIPYTTTSFDWWTSSYTLEFWINPLVSNFRIGNMIINGVTQYWGLAVESNTLSFYYYNGTPQPTIYAATGTVPLNTWTHVALTYVSGTGVRLFVNGVLENTTAINGTPQSNGATPLLIGGYNSGYFNGYISNLRIVKGTALYTSTFTPSTIPLTAVANTQLLTCQTSQSVVTDESTNKFTITNFGTTKPTRKTPFTLTDTTTANTTYSGSYYLNGNGDYLTVASNSQTALQSNDFTIEAWCAFANGSANAFGTIYTNYTTFSLNSNSIFFGKHTQYSGRVAFWMSNYSATVAFLEDPTLPPANAWVHYAVVRNGNTFTMYRNGVSVASGTYTGSITASTNLSRIGSDAGAAHFTGYISNFRIVNGTAVYTSAFTPPTTPLTAVANTQLLLSGTNSGIFDATLQNNLQTNGDTKVRTNITKYGTGSMYFDGTGDNILLPYNAGHYLKNADFTIECWVYALALPGYGVILNLGGGSNIAYASYELIIMNSSIRFAGSTANTGYDIGGENTSGNLGTITINTWTHVAITRSGSTFRGFVNGVQGWTATITGSFYDPTPRGLVVGASYSNTWGTGTPTNGITGYIDDVRITKGYARYTANFTPPAVALKNN